MTDKEKMQRIEEVYQVFLKELRELKKQANANAQAEIQSIEQKEIDKILNKIKTEL